MSRREDEKQDFFPRSTRCAVCSVTRPFDKIDPETKACIEVKVCTALKYLGEVARGSKS